MFACLHNNNISCGEDPLTIFYYRQGVPEVILGEPSADEVAILWQTSAACKTTTSLRYTSEAKCYHIHTYEDDGLRANFIDLTSLICLEGYQVLNSEDSHFKFLLSVCKPMVFAGSGDTEHPSGCNGTMACLVEAGEGLGATVPLVLGGWSAGGLGPRLHMHEGLLSIQYSIEIPKGGGTCGSMRNVTIHFLCPDENQVNGCSSPHVHWFNH